MFAFLARLLQFAPSELTMFAGGQKDGNVIVILNLFISSGTRWSEEEATLYLFAPTTKWKLVSDGLSIVQSNCLDGNTSRANSDEQDLTTLRVGKR